MRNNRALIWFVFLATAVGACAGPVKKAPKKTVTSEHEQIVQMFLGKARQHEKEGDLAEALKQYKLALAVSPQNRVAIKNRQRLEANLRILAERRYRSGLKLHRQGKYVSARRQFLKALRLNPDHAKARNMLTAHIHVAAKRYVVHKIKPEESLSKLAMIYYGSHEEFPIIAAYNNIDDATRVEVGQELKVPEIDGVPFLAEKEDIRAEEPEPSDSQSVDEVSEEQPSEAASLEAPEEYVDVVAMYRDEGIELFNKKKYQEAIVELNKAVNVNSNDTATLEYLHKSHFQQAMVFFVQEDYLSAKKEFEVSLRYESDCQQCHEYARKSEETYKELHYNRGISYFGKELLAEAIKEWESVRALDPKYREVENNIKKARMLLKRLEEIKKTGQEQQPK
jgi:tetratricopeptide (TPR) repeat protein